jgi:GINS complex subunit 2
MALPKHLQQGLTPEELTFLAEEELISIVPSISMTKIRVLSVSHI